MTTGMILYFLLLVSLVPLLRGLYPGCITKHSLVLFYYLK